MVHRICIRNKFKYHCILLAEMYIFLQKMRTSLTTYNVSAHYRLCKNLFWLNQENTGYYLLVFSVSLQCKYLLCIQVSSSRVWGKSLLASSPSPSPSFSFQTYIVTFLVPALLHRYCEGNLHHKLDSAFPKKNMGI